MIEMEVESARTVDSMQRQRHARVGEWPRTKRGNARGRAAAVGGGKGE